MTLAIIRGIFLRGRYARVSDKYWDPPPGPTDHDILGVLSSEGTYKRVENYLKKHGRVEVSERVNPLPFIQEGIISAPAAASCYSLNDCLVLNFTRPYGLFNGGVAHIIEAAGYKKNVKGIERTLQTLKDAAVAGASWRLEAYWEKTKERKVEVPGLLERGLASHLHLLMEK